MLRGVDSVTLKRLLINPFSGSGMPASIDNIKPTKSVHQEFVIDPIAD